MLSKIIGYFCIIVIISICLYIGTFGQYFFAFDSQKSKAKLHLTRSEVPKVNLSITTKADLTKLDCSIKLGKFNQFKPILLVSIPGSGNTWARQLIESSTGYATGSIYFDPILYDKGRGLIGEATHTQMNKLIVVKNHQVDPTIDQYFKTPIAGCLFVIRNPVNAIIADFTRRSWNHTCRFFTKI